MGKSDRGYLNERVFNTERSYECNCHNGYDGDGKNCFDVNECDKVLKVMVSHAMTLMNVSKIVTIATATLNALTLHQDSNVNVTMDTKVMVLHVVKSTNVRKITAMQTQSALIMSAISHVNVTMDSKVTV